MSDPNQPPHTRPAPEPASAQPPQARPDPEPVSAQPPPAAQPTHYPPPRDRGFKRVVGHRATQLVAVGLIGLVLGGGVVALADRDGDRRHGSGFDRPGHSRSDERGRGFDR